MSFVLAIVEVSDYLILQYERAYSPKLREEYALRTVRSAPSLPLANAVHAVVYCRFHCRGSPTCTMCLGQRCSYAVSPSTARESGGLACRQRPSPMIAALVQMPSTSRNRRLAFNKQLFALRCLPFKLVMDSVSATEEQCCRYREKTAPPKNLLQILSSLLHYITLWSIGSRAKISISG